MSEGIAIRVKMTEVYARPGTATAHAYFVQHFCNQVFQPTGTKSIGEVKKLAEERWRGMTDGEKKPYKDLADSAKQPRYGKGQANVPAGAVAAAGSRKRKRKAKKDPNAPKRATTAFFFFAQVERSKVRDAHPEWKVTEISKELGKMWSAMEPEAKLRYEQSAVKDRQRYQEEMARYAARMQNSVNGGSEEYSEEDYH